LPKTGTSFVRFCHFQEHKIDFIMELYRSIIEDLKDWKSRPDRKPLILKGAKQTGKTWIS
jgi:predicted AAA+ superfamily ATPase